jgi:hypothetical protein
LEPARLPVGNADAASATSGQKQQYREAKPFGDDLLCTHLNEY